MDRFWRTLREQCLDLTGSIGSLHDLNARLTEPVDQTLSRRRRQDGLRTGRRAMRLNVHFTDVDRTAGRGA
jgi:hypothetical protein